MVHTTIGSVAIIIWHFEEILLYFFFYLKSSYIEYFLPFSSPLVVTIILLTRHASRPPTQHYSCSLM